MYLSSLRSRRIILTSYQLQLACREPYGRKSTYKKHDAATYEPNGTRRWFWEGGAGTPVTAFSKAEIDAARTWLHQLSSDTIPKSEIEVTMSRSSGPGGQNVNKVNSKVTLRIPFTTIEKHAPKLIHDSLREHPWYVKRSESILIKCDGSRYKRQNEHDAYRKLEDLLRVTAEDMLPGETLESQRRKVQGLKRDWEREKKQFKILLSAKKASRRNNED